jgi:hypothetical protein
MNALALISEPVASLPAILLPEIEAAADYAKDSKAAGTLSGYARDFELFRGWCSARGLSALPADPPTVATHLASLAQAGLMPATISRRVSAHSILAQARRVRAVDGKRTGQGDAIRYQTHKHHSQQAQSAYFGRACEGDGERCAGRAQRLAR